MGNQKLLDVQDKLKTMSERGIYTGATEDSYVEASVIRQKNSPEFVMTPTVNPSDRSLGEWVNHFEYLNDRREEVQPTNNFIEVRFPSIPKFIAVMGDTHIGGDCDYALLGRHVAMIADTEGTHALFLGDLVDGYFWGKGRTQDARANISEEAYFAQKIMEVLNGKTIAAWGGDHDLWAEKGGLSMYHNFTRDTGAHYFQGTAFIDFYLGDKVFHTGGAHRSQGHSIYSHTAAAQRLAREQGPNLDITFVGHNHTKAMYEQIEFDGPIPRRSLYLTIGPYKRSDSWLKKQGYPYAKDVALGGFGLILYPDGNVECHWDIERGLTRFKSL